VNVTANAVGVFTNSTGPVSTTNAGTGTAATANLTVVGGITATKAFSPTTTVTGIAFTDTYPAGVTNSNAPGGVTNCTSGSVTAAANGPSVALSGAQL